MTSAPSTKAPKDALKAVYSAGKYKAALTLDVLMVQSFMAGIYIAMAGHLFLALGGGILGAAFFPTGLIAVLLTSAELFTGDALIFIASVLGGKVSIRSLCRNWTVAWICNMAGCLAWAFFMVYLSDSLKDLDKDDFAVKVALKKANQPWGNIFLKGIGANFMVCLGVWQFTCAEEVAGKVLALWFPITGFVIMGFDHCIANQFFIRKLLLFLMTMMMMCRLLLRMNCRRLITLLLFELKCTAVGMMLGADISVSHLLFRALLPATLGNLVGGGLLIGGVYWYVFDSMDTVNRFRERIHHSWKKPTGNESRRVSMPSTSLYASNYQTGQSPRRESDLFRRFRRRSSTPDAV